MPLPPLVLDDLDWQRLSDASRQRIPALSAGKWTLHSPVDPGITLVELYAWLLDQRVYWIDRVPEPMFRAVVELLGEKMEPVKSARTVVALERSGTLSEVRAGTALGIPRADAGPIFSTSEGIQLLKVARVGLSVGGVDRTHDLDEQRGVTLFGADGSPGEARITLYISSAPPAAATRPFSLFLEVQEAPDVLPQWNPEAVTVAPPAEITWWYSRTAPQAPGQFATNVVRDGTGGLRRAGIVRLPVPADWAPDGPAVGGLTPYSLFLRTRAATFTFPPSVNQIVPNAVLAQHTRVVRERRREEFLALPGQAITLDESFSPPIPERVRLHVREVDGHWHRWLPVADFARSGPTDRVFRVDRARRRIEFGNGLTGRIPRPMLVPVNAYNMRIAISVGGGVDGNVGAGVEWAGEAVSASDLSATSLTTAVGGIDAEGVDLARVRIGGLLNRVERAVTPEDHVDLARDTPGVAIARAHAAVGFHPGHACVAVPGTVTVFVVPWAPRGAHVEADERIAAPQPDPGALRAVRARLENARMVGTQVWVCPPRYRKVRLAVRILGDPVDPAAARARVTETLRRFLDPLEGGDDREGWPFGDPLRPSVLMREGSSADGDGDVDSVSIGLDGEAPSENCQEVRIGPHDLPALVDVTVTFAPDVRARAGGLR